MTVFGTKLPFGVRRPKVRFTHKTARWYDGFTIVSSPNLFQTLSTKANLLPYCSYIYSNSELTCSIHSEEGGAMFAHISTVTFEGIEARVVNVQVQIGPGLPSFTT